MSILRHIALTVGLIWAVVFRVCPSVAGTNHVRYASPTSVVKQDAHGVNVATDPVVYLIQDEDDTPVPSPNPDLLPVLPAEWLRWFMTVLLLPILLTLSRKSKPSSQPYYLLYCSLRIPLA